MTFTFPSQVPVIPLSHMCSSPSAHTINQECSVIIFREFSVKILVFLKYFRNFQQCFYRKFQCLFCKMEIYILYLISFQKIFSLGGLKGIHVYSGQKIGYHACAQTDGRLTECEDRARILDSEFEIKASLTVAVHAAVRDTTHPNLVTDPGWFENCCPQNMKAPTLLMQTFLSFDSF